MAKHRTLQKTRRFKIAVLETRRFKIAALGPVIAGAAAAGVVSLVHTGSPPAKAASSPVVKAAPSFDLPPKRQPLPAKKQPLPAYITKSGDTLWDVAHDQCGDGAKW